ncbi:hypothetical protein Tco_0544389, partial [Tanacetum coccineum]
MQAKGEMLAWAGQARTQITGRKRREISSEATLHVLVNVGEKLKENGTQLTMQIIDNLLELKK